MTTVCPNASLLPLPVDFQRSVEYDPVATGDLRQTMRLGVFYFTLTCRNAFAVYETRPFLATYSETLNEENVLVGDYHFKTYGQIWELVAAAGSGISQLLPEVRDSSLHSSHKCF